MLVNNAGILPEATSQAGEVIDVELFRETFATNLFGPVAVTEAFLPQMTSVCPGFVQTDLTPMNRQHAPLTPQEAAAVVVRAATLPDGSPSGTFIDSTGHVRW